MDCDFQFWMVDCVQRCDLRLLILVMGPLQSCRGRAFYVNGVIVLRIILLNCDAMNRFTMCFTYILTQKIDFFYFLHSISARLEHDVNN